jgi:hypothetical protein
MKPDYKYIYTHTHTHYLFKTHFIIPKSTPAPLKSNLSRSSLMPATCPVHLRYCYCKDNVVAYLGLFIQHPSAIRGPTKANGENDGEVPTDTVHMQDDLNDCVLSSRWWDCNTAQHCP